MFSPESTDSFTPLFSARERNPSVHCFTNSLRFRRKNVMFIFPF